MRIEYEPAARRGFYGILLRIPDGLLLLLTAGWTAAGGVLVLALVGNPDAWWKQVIVSVAIGGPGVIGLNLSQTKRRLEAEQRRRTDV